MVLEGRHDLSQNGLKGSTKMDLKNPLLMRTGSLRSNLLSSTPSQRTGSLRSNLLTSTPTQSVTTENMKTPPSLQTSYNPTALQYGLCSLTQSKFLKTDKKCALLTSRDSASEKNSQLKNPLLSTSTKLSGFGTLSCLSKSDLYKPSSLLTAAPILSNKSNSLLTAAPLLSAKPSMLKSALSATTKQYDLGAHNADSSVKALKVKQERRNPSEELLHKPQSGKTKKVYKEKLAKARKVAQSACVDRETILRNYSISERPVYNLGKGIAVRGIELPNFIPPEKDLHIQRILRPVQDVTVIKRNFINAVSGSLIRSPNFRQKDDSVRFDMIQIADRVAQYDSEFILKVALYTRNELNIRTTANFLLTYAAHNPTCRPHLRKYFSASIRLPSDWIEVAEQYQSFSDTHLQLGALPVALRKVMTEKFEEFDKFQLAKYNKESSGKKKKSEGADRKGADSKGADKEGADNKELALGFRGRGRGQFRGRGVPRGRGRATGTLNRNDLTSDDAESDTEHKPEFSSLVDTDHETEEEVVKMTFTLKQLIRKLHITKPVEHVMCLLGKKYPATSEDFYLSGLPDVFDEERANKRMKLPVPETWETQVSLKGNKASTWEQLIDNKKLPFMAMLRNLRNMIKAGISEKHHSWVLKKLTNEYAVVNSRQFPFRFFTAYDVLDQLEKDYEKTQIQLVEDAVALTEGPSRGRGRGRGRGQSRGRGQGRGGIQGRGGGQGRGRGRGGRDSGRPRKTEETKYDVPLLHRYKKALDSAVKIATVHNVKPIRGNTVIFCNLGPQLSQPCTSARGLGKSVTLADVGALLGLMCKYSCEESLLVAYGVCSHREVELEKGTILDNMKSVTQLQPILNEDTTDGSSVLPTSILHEMLRDRTRIDNLIVLSDGMSLHSTEGTAVVDFLKKYRVMVNPDLLFVSVDLSGASAGFDRQIQPGHNNDIYLSGFSDQILRFVAERGDSGQLIHVENIDTAYDLKAKVSAGLDKIPLVKPRENPEGPLALTLLTPRWRTARVFISSTFRDMHGERDLLTRYVFPELRALAQKHFVNVYEVDLRWGVTEESTRNNKTLELCLGEIARCQYFIGILGRRYGWVPDEYIIPDTPEYDWVREYPKGASVTELEFHCAALRKDGQARTDQSFFYLRDDMGYEDIPQALEEDFISLDQQILTNLQYLKSRVCQSGAEVFDGYPWRWGGVVNSKPVAVDLEEFGQRVLLNLWTAIQRDYPSETVLLDEQSHETALHEAFVESQRSKFVGRRSLLKQLKHMLYEQTSQVIGLIGKPGSGKSALMAAFVHEYVESKQCESGLNVFTHFVGAAPGSKHIVPLLTRFCHELIRRFNVDFVVPEGYKNLVMRFDELLKDCAASCATPLVFVVDGLDLLEDAYQAKSLEWIPEILPKNVVFVLSAKEGSDPHHAVLRRPTGTLLLIGPLEILDKGEVVRKTLAAYRKELDESAFNNQMKILLSKKEANTPLYLSLVCEELRVFGLFDQLMPMLKSLPHTVSQLLQDTLARLETDHGRDLVSTTLCLLVCARDGLEENELHDLLGYHRLLGDSKISMDFHNINLDVDSVIPMATMAHLLRSIKSFLRPTADSNSQHLVLAHLDIANAVRQRYIKSVVGDVETRYHQLLAGYYCMLGDPDHNDTWKGNSVRSFSELPYHLAQGGLYTQLEAVLCNLYFIHGKARLGLVGQLLDDFQGQARQGFKFSEREQKKFIAVAKVCDYKAFVSRNLHILSSHPSLTWQLALNDVNTSAPYADVRRILATNTVTADLTLMEWRNKPSEADPCVYTINNLPKLVTCVAVSPDCRMFACGSEDCTVKVYDMDTGKELRNFTGHSNAITDVCFVGVSRVCSASSDNLLSLWSVSDGHRISVMKGHKRKVNTVTCTPDNKLIISAGWDCAIKVWITSSGKLDADLSEGRPINCIACHPEGQLVATGSWDSAIRIWDIFHKTRKAVLRGHMTSVRDLAYSPSGRHIASAALDGEVKLWSAGSGSQVGSLVGHALPINRLSFTPSGHELITVSDDHKIKIWSGHMGKPLSQLMSEETGDKHPGGATAVAICPDGESVAVGYHEGEVCIYDLLSGLLKSAKKLHSAVVTAIQFTKDNTLIITASADDTARVLDVEGRKKGMLVGHAKGLTSIAVSRDRIVTTSEDFTANVYDLQLVKDNGVWKPNITLTGHNGVVTCCAFNSQGDLLVTGSRDKSLRIWDMISMTPGTTVQPVRILNECHSDWINSCDWSNTGDFIVTASNDFNLKLWDARSGEEKVKFTGHMAAVNHVSHKYGCIVSCAFDGSVKVWTHKGTEITTLHGHKQTVNACDMFIRIQVKPEAASEVSDWATMVEENDWKTKHEKTKLEKKDVKLQEVVVATASDDGSVRLWKPLEGNELACYTSHTSRVLSVSVGRDGRICTSGRDHSVRIWQSSPNQDDSRPDHVMPSHDAEVTTMDCSTDGNLLVTGSRDGCMKLWQIDEVNGLLQHPFSVKVSDKCLGAAAFVEMSSTSMFIITGSHDGHMTRWKVVTSRNRKLIRKCSGSATVAEPITQISWIKDTHQILVSGWTRQAAIWNIHPKSGALVMQGAIDSSHSDWVLAHAVSRGSPDPFLVTCGMDEKLVIYKPSQKSFFTQAAAHRCGFAGNKDLPAEKRQANWLCCVTCYNDHVFVGDLHGGLTIMIEGNIKSRKTIHTAEITACQVIDGVLVTASRDLTIKLWNVNTMQQVGHYFTTSPVLHMRALSTQKQIILVCGNQLGQILVYNFWR